MVSIACRNSDARVVHLCRNRTAAKHIAKESDSYSLGSMIVITGGSGFLGINLANALIASGEDVCIVARTKPRTLPAPCRFVSWDASTLGDWVSVLEGARGIVNLTGRSVDCIKTPDHCDEILRSRVEPTLLIGEALRHVSDPPKVWVQMSTAHIYGDPPTAVCTESSPFGYGLAPFVGIAWESAFEQAALPAMRKVILRTSFVMGRTGGALRRMETVVRMGMSGKIGTGMQGISWLHEADMNNIFLRALNNENMSGAYIASAPIPVPKKEFMQKLRKAMKFPFGLPSPEWLVRFGAHYLFRTDPELALYGRYCVPKRLIDEGFEFEYPTIADAFSNIYS